MGLAFIVLLMLVLEFCWQMATSAALDYGAREATRTAITGSSCAANGTSRSTMITALVSTATNNFIRSDILTVTATAYANFDNYQSSTAGTVGNGYGGQTVVYVFSYAQPYVTGIAAFLLGSQSLQHSTTVVVQNDPFPC